MNYLFPSLGFNFLLAVLREASRDIKNFMVPLLEIIYTFAVVRMALFGGLINKDENRNQYEVRHAIYVITDMCKLLTQVDRN